MGGKEGDRKNGWEISGVGVGWECVDGLEGAGLEYLKIQLVAFFLGEEAFLGGVEVTMRLQLVIHKLGGNRPAKRAFQLSPLRSVLLIILFEAAKADEVHALTAGQNAVERQRANGATVYFRLTYHLRAQVAHECHLVLAVLGH